MICTGSLLWLRKWLLRNDARHWVYLQWWWVWVVHFSPIHRRSTNNDDDDDNDDNTYYCKCIMLWIDVLVKEEGFGWLLEGFAWQQPMESVSLRQSKETQQTNVEQFQKQKGLSYSDQEDQVCYLENHEQGQIKFYQDNCPWSSQLYQGSVRNLLNVCSIQGVWWKLVTMPWDKILSLTVVSRSFTIQTTTTTPTTTTEDENCEYNEINMNLLTDVSKLVVMYYCGWSKPHQVFQSHHLILSSSSELPKWNFLANHNKWRQQYYGFGCWLRLDCHDVPRNTLSPWRRLRTHNEWHLWRCTCTQQSKLANYYLRRLLTNRLLCCFYFRVSAADMAKAPTVSPTRMARWYWTLMVRLFREENLVVPKPFHFLFRMKPLRPQRHRPQR